MILPDLGHRHGLRKDGASKECAYRSIKCIRVESAEMKVSIGCDERWPDYYVETDHALGGNVELTDDELADLRRVEIEYDQWQEKLRLLFLANR